MLTVQGIFLVESRAFDETANGRKIWARNPTYVRAKTKSGTNWKNLDSKSSIFKVECLSNAFFRCLLKSLTVFLKHQRQLESAHSYLTVTAIPSNVKDRGHGVGEDGQVLPVRYFSQAFDVDVDAQQ